MKRSYAAVIVTVACLLWVAPASATTVTLQAALSGSQENPSNLSPATGFVTAIYDDQSTASFLDDMLGITMSFSGLSAPSFAAHIHRAPPGVNGPVRVDFGLAGFPLGVTSGSYSQIFLNTDGTNTQVVFGATGGGISLTDLLAGNGYVNIHNAVFPGGEIRGQLVQAAAVPEPATLTLLGTGLILAVRRRLRSR